MPAIGLLVLLAGAFLISSAISNRNPVETLVSVVRDPASAQTILAASKGTGAVSTYTPIVTSGGDNIAPGGNPGESSGGALSSGVSGVGVGAAAPGTGAAIVAFARSQIGKPYLWGATGPESWDCSGLTQAAARSAGIAVPRVTGAQVLSGRAVSRDQLQPGDLVFPDPGHVGIYSGNGMFIDAPRAGGKVSERKPWAFYAARRITK